MKTTFSIKNYQLRTRGGLRALITLKTPECLRGGSGIGMIDVVEEFDDWQLVSCFPCAQAILCMDTRNRLLCYFPKSGLSTQLRTRHFDCGTWHLGTDYHLPKNVCTSLRLPPGSRIRADRYAPIDLGSHLVFRLRCS